MAEQIIKVLNINKQKMYSQFTQLSVKCIVTEDCSGTGKLYI